MLSIQRAPSPPELERLRAPRLKLILGTYSVFPWDPLQRAGRAVSPVWGERPPKPCSSLQVQTVSWGWRCQEGRHICPEVREPPRGEAPEPTGLHLRGGGVVRGAESEKTNSLRQPGLFSHIHTPGCLKVTCNQTFTGQELPFVLLRDQIRSDK